MHQGSSVPSSNTEMQGLHPILQVALDSLDVELEEELTRYRRQRYRQSRLGGRQSSLLWKSPTEKSRSTNSSLDLPNFDAAPHPTQASHPEPPADRAISDRPTSSPQPPLLTAPLALERGNPVAQEKISHLQQANQTATPQASVAQTLAWADRPQPIASTALPDQARLAAIEPDQNPDPATQANLARLDAEEAPEDYLESTEELLRSIIEETPDLRAERESNLLDSLLTPLGIGSMLLLLLSSATLGYVIMHPSSLDLLTAQEAAGENEVGSTESSPASAGTTSIPDTPNLAADEFVDLNLDTLSTVPRSGSRSSEPQATSSPTTTSPTGTSSSSSSGTSDNASTNPDSIVSSSSSSSSGASGSGIPPVASLTPDPVVAAPAAAPTYTEPTYTAPTDAAPAYTTPTYSEPAYTTPAPSSATSPAASPSAIVPSTSDTVPPMSAATSPATRSGNYYYVVTPYSGDSSLEQAREAVPDAYVRNFSAGASVQLGAFSDPTKAEGMLQQLQEQGISAEIYQPQ